MVASTNPGDFPVTEGMSIVPTTTQESAPAGQDFPVPQVVADPRPFLWDDDQPTALLYPPLARRLRESGDIYRLPSHAAGLLLASPCPDIPPTQITKGGDLASVITDRVPVSVVKDGKAKGSRIPMADLNTMLHSELFLREFQAIDQVVLSPMYLSDFTLTKPGYNDGLRGQRIYYVGDDPLILRTTEAIDRFLEVMEFGGDADRTIVERNTDEAAV
jgi:hypothetical protein